MLRYALAALSTLYALPSLSPVTADFCGPDGICGGVGAPCNTNNYNDYADYRCDASNYCAGTFTQDGPTTGVCEPSGPSGSSAAVAGLVACSSDATCTATIGPGVHCAPDGYCGDTGAVCSSNIVCFDACGSDGICGGAGALCDSDNNDDYTGYKCTYGCGCTSHVSALLYQIVDDLSRV
ncbi:hypothetical protein CALVIDRAFT_251104 [Calocera viscosa TUFC12733]|uniref:Carbohydrate-binding module family 18 protein n=1 Tax=Calocera viscosa (strain TUFC12733) TaxID=1330018 RepID=A0A167JFA6_CALVF|nr:hypothetical protein CALVIDRAFT_251104 [Calocera viscosa TUFC12733]